MDITPTKKTIMISYDIEIIGNDIFAIGFRTKASSFKQAYDIAKAHLEQCQKLTIEQLRIKSIIESEL